MAAEATVVETAPKETPKGMALARTMEYEDGGIQIRTMEDAIAWGKMAIDSGFAPSNFEKPSQVVMAVQIGAELGLKPASSLRALYPTPQNKLALYAEAALALCLKSGALVGHRHEFFGEGDGLGCRFSVIRKGSAAWQESEFTVGEAKKAGLVRSGSGWEKWTKRMLLARARSFALHDGFPDVLMGVAIEGDLDDLAVEPPAKRPEAPPRKAPGGFGLLDKIEAKPAETPVEAEIVPAATAMPEAVPAAAAPPPAPASLQSDEVPDIPQPNGCQHRQARTWLADRPSGKPVVCEDCTFDVRLSDSGKYEERGEHGTWVRC